MVLANVFSNLLYLNAPAQKIYFLDSVGRLQFMAFVKNASSYLDYKISKITSYRLTRTACYFTRTFI